MLGAGFRDALLADPDLTLTDFDLIESETAALKRPDSETMDLLAHTLAVRVRKINQVSTGVRFDLFTCKMDEK